MNTIEMKWAVDKNGELIKVPFINKQPKEKKPKPVDTVKHGTPTMYFSRGCRCEPCRKSATAHQRITRHARYRNTPFESIPHGTKNGYSNYGCRCAPCGKAMYEANKGYKESPEAKARRNERKRAKRLLAKQLAEANNQPPL